MDKFLALQEEGSSILDVGCGSGEPIDRYFVNKGSVVIGIDTSSELLGIARQNIPEATWVFTDMRSLRLDKKFSGILAWNSTFHLTPFDQRQMFAVFEEHAANNAILMFTSGPSRGTSIGELEGEPLYHASLDAAEYRMLLGRHGFTVLDHVVSDPECGNQTIWLAQFNANS